MSRILLVEDDPGVREIVKIALEREGMAVEEVGDGESALRSFRSLRSFDLVVLDIMLPGIDGITVCQEIRRTSRVPIVVLTAHEGETSVVVGLEVGVDDDVTKPFSTAELVSRVRAHLRRRRMDARDSDQRLDFPGLVIDLCAGRYALVRHMFTLPPRSSRSSASSRRIPGRSSAATRSWSSSWTELTLAGPILHSC